MKTIKYYRKSQYGQDREFVAPENEADGQLIRQLIGQKTITPGIRAVIESLTNGAVSFVETIAPYTATAVLVKSESSPYNQDN